MKCHKTLCTAGRAGPDGKVSFGVGEFAAFQSRVLMGYGSLVPLSPQSVLSPITGTHETAQMNSPLSSEATCGVNFPDHRNAWGYSFYITKLVAVFTFRHPLPPSQVCMYA